MENSGCFFGKYQDDPSEMFGDGDDGDGERKIMRSFYPNICKLCEGKILIRHRFRDLVPIAYDISKTVVTKVFFRRRGRPREAAWLCQTLESSRALGIVL